MARLLQILLSLLLSTITFPITAHAERYRPRGSWEQVTITDREGQKHTGFFVGHLTEVPKPRSFHRRASSPHNSDKEDPPVNYRNDASATLSKYSSTLSSSSSYARNSAGYNPILDARQAGLNYTTHEFVTMKYLPRAPLGILGGYLYTSNIETFVYGRGRHGWAWLGVPYTRPFRRRSAAFGLAKPITKSYRPRMKENGHKVRF